MVLIWVCLGGVVLTLSLHAYVLCYAIPSMGIKQRDFSPIVNKQSKL